jgi:hypothetical protein
MSDEAMSENSTTVMALSPRDCFACARQVEQYGSPVVGRRDDLLDR